MGQFHGQIYHSVALIFLSIHNFDGQKCRKSHTQNAENFVRQTFFIRNLITHIQTFLHPLVEFEKNLNPSNYFLEA